MWGRMQNMCLSNFVVLGDSFCCRFKGAITHKEIKTLKRYVSLHAVQESSAAMSQEERNFRALELKAEFSKIVGEKNVSSATSTLEQNGVDEGPYTSAPPGLVLWPQSTLQVSEIAKLCNRENIPLIPRGTGTGLEGGSTASQGGVCINLMKMDQVVAFHPEDFDVTVQPGITRKSLNQYIKDQGLWFPIDPGADASVCGMAATSASGTNAVRYGTMRENVMNLEVVLADGRILHTAGKNRRTKKTSAGYNLTNLFVGSEGTLGIITNATVRLHAVPETMIAALCSYPSVKSAVETVIQTIQSGVPIARMELVDEIGIEAVNKYSKLNLPVAPTLFLEFHGTPSSTREQAQTVESISEENGGTGFRWAEELEERTKIWQARHDMYYALKALRPGWCAMPTDVCVPISKLADVVVATQELIKEYGLFGNVIGHVGDGNFHATLIFDPDKTGSLQDTKALAVKIAQLGLAVDGTCTGEHGIGYGKISLLEEEQGEVGIDIMRKLKQTLDPKNLMNPGKVLSSNYV